MSAAIIPFPVKAREPETPDIMWRVEGGGLALLIGDLGEAMSFLRDGWERVVMVERRADGSYAVVAAGCG